MKSLFRSRPAIAHCKVVLLLAAVLVWGAPRQAALGQDPPPSDLEVHELTLWILGPGNAQANAKAAHLSALPASVQSARKPATDAKAPLGPLSLLTFYGKPLKDLDVDLRTKSGTFLAHWPPGEGLPNRLRWSGMPSYDLVEKVEGESELTFVDPEHWMHAARQGDALFIKHGARSERFLAYDLEANLGAPLQLDGGPDEFTVANVSGVPVYDVLIVRPTPEGRRLAWIDTIPPGASVSPKPVGEKAAVAAPKQAAVDLFDEPAKSAAKQPEPAQPQAAEPAQQEAAKEVPLPATPDKPAEKPAATSAPAADSKPPVTKLFGGLPAKAKLAKPADKPRAAAPPARPALFGGLPAKAKVAMPAAAPSHPLKGVTVSLAPALAVGSAELKAQTVDAMQKRMLGAGLKPAEVDRFLKYYGPALFEGEGVVVVCRPSAAAIDEKVPLSIFPEPAKIVRVPIVVMRNADPQLGSEVDRLVAQLGNPSYAERQAAHKRLTELGPLAFARLQKALDDGDPEIVIRAERILLQQNQTPNPQAKGGLRVIVNGKFVPAAAPAIRFNAN